MNIDEIRIVHNQTYRWFYTYRCTFDEYLSLNDYHLKNVDKVFIGLRAIEWLYLTLDYFDEVEVV